MNTNVNEMHKASKSICTCVPVFDLHKATSWSRFERFIDEPDKICVIIPQLIQTFRVYELVTPNWVQYTDSNTISLNLLD